MRQRLWNRTLNLGVRFQRSSEDFLAKLHLPLQAPQNLAILRGPLSSSVALHDLFLPLPKGHSEPRQQAAGLVVGAGCGDDRHFQPAQFVDLVVVDLREDDLLAHSQRVVATAVETLGADAPKVTDTWQRDVEQLVEEVPHAAPAKRGLDPDRLARAQLEGGDRFL